MHRLFVALRPPPDVRRLLLAAMDTGVPVRWQDDDQLHLTVRFIGEVDTPAADDIASALSGVWAPAPVVRIAGTGAFRHRGRVDALWAAVAPHEALARLHRKVDQACVRAGIMPEGRAYRPHVTLARVPRSQGADPALDRWLAAHATLASPAFPLSHLVLYASHLGRHGAHYEMITRHPLGTADAAAGFAS